MLFFGKFCLRCKREFDDVELRVCPDDNTMLAPLVREEIIGTTIDGKYHVLELINSGAWGNVYRARHLELGNTVAVKVLHEKLVNDSDAVARFEQEASMLRSLRNRHIVSTFDFGFLDKARPYLVMEYLAGSNLKEFCEAPNITLSQLLDLFMHVCDGLAAVHSAGVVHRDIKPNNIICVVDADGVVRAKVFDFGLARIYSDPSVLFESTTPIGTPSYMSPEQCTGGKADLRADIYALGCVMYEILTGQKPFRAPSRYELMNKHLSAWPPMFRDTKYGATRPRLLEHIVFKCLSKNPSGRYQTAQELRYALSDAALVAASVA